MTNSTDRVEIITSVQRRRRWTAPGKRRDLRAGYDGKPGGSSAWRCPKPVVHLASAGGARRPAAGKRSCRLVIIGLCRTKFANFIGSWARRRWKRRFSKRPSNMPQGQKNNCGCRRRRGRTVPDEDRGRGNWRVPLQSCGPSPGTVQEADRSAPATGRRTGIQDQGGHRRAGDLRLAIGGFTPFSSGRRWLQV